jgi:sulfite reductase beta subunit-like hemoprotein
LSLTTSPHASSYVACPGASACRATRHVARRRLLRLAQDHTSCV